MIRVGFIATVSKEWMGGLNYFKNLLYAISVLDNKQIEPIVFIGVKTDEEIKSLFRQYAMVVEHPMFDTKSFLWQLWKITDRVFGFPVLLEKILHKYNIDVLSHSGVVNSKRFKTINWIPDFQYIHLPDMFSQKEIINLNRRYKLFSEKSDLVIVSSFNAQKDYLNYFSKDNSAVLQFVSQPAEEHQAVTVGHKERLFTKYLIDHDFFYLPNQFWKHKNHISVFKAIKVLKEQGIEKYLICTGHLDDYRNKEYIQYLRNYIVQNRLEDNIKLLGLIPYSDVYSLIQFSIAVINPSLFEGWSSTVEECKSVGKNMILSNIEVHKEQYPNATFFSKDDFNELANVLKNYLLKNTEKKIASLEERTQQFAQTYHNIITKVLQ